MQRFLYSSASLGQTRVSPCRFNPVTFSLFIKCNFQMFMLQVEKRSVLPDGGGTVRFSCPTRSKLQSLNLIQPGKIKRIRGIAFASLIFNQIQGRSQGFIGGGPAGAIWVYQWKLFCRIFNREKFLNFKTCRKVLQGLKVLFQIFSN